MEELANGPAAGTGIGNNDRLTGTIGASPGKATDDLLDDMTERLESLDDEPGPQAGYEDESASDDDADLFSDDTPPRPPQYEPDQQVAHTLLQYQAALEREAHSLQARQMQLQQAGLPPDAPEWQRFQQDVAQYQNELKSYNHHQCEAQAAEAAQYQERLEEWQTSRTSGDPSGNPELAGPGTARCGNRRYQVHRTRCLRL